MPIPTIDHQPILADFKNLLLPNSPVRVLRLEGEAKLGKTHLMTKVFPTLADEVGVLHTILDFRKQTNTLNILHHFCGPPFDMLCDFAAFDEAYQDWLTRPEIDMQGFKASFAQISVRSPNEQEAQKQAALHLVRKFVADLQTINQTVLFLLDSVEQTESATQHWLIHTFLDYVARLPHVRVAVAGRTLPEPPSSYSRFCHHLKLGLVEDEAAYRHYCEAIGLTLDGQLGQSLPLFIQGAGYKPGLFADLAQNLQGATRA